MGRRACGQRHAGTIARRERNAAGNEFVLTGRYSAEMRGAAIRALPVRGASVWAFGLSVLPACLAQDTPAAAPRPSRELAEVAAAYAAKVAASALFVSGRTLDSVLAQELAPTRPLEALIRPLLQFDVDEPAGTVTARLGQAKATAVRTKHLGC